MLNIARIEDTPTNNTEATIELWIAANEAKAERIRQLEAERDGLRVRVARLARMARDRPDLRAPATRVGPTAT